MHVIQERLLELSKEYDLVNMKLSVIGKLIGVAHLQTVKHHRDQLIKHGYIEANDKKTGLFEDSFNTETQAELIRIPVRGTINAGPAAAVADDRVQGFLRISSSLLKTSAPVDELYALKVEGRSMNQAAVGGYQTIDDGDYLIVDGRDFEPKSGDYVISLIDNMANVKRFVLDRLNKQIVLMSESTDDFPPIVIHPDDPADFDYLAKAKVVQVVKKPKVA
ncbi:hypothetical protein HY003_04095 [Candidatus Saccharibacteria bacterium]|nr:hypothetical protein [Candidatus Saccharibacteria bacterium]MBI3338451.1 hypothetical protein [Candidatus Saccharibacteria bacterium]